MITVAMIDDNKKELEIFCNTIKELRPRWDIHRYDHPAEFNVTQYHAIFLDIELHGFAYNGLQLAQKINEKSNSPIIFLTSHSECALIGYKVNAFRFIIKKEFYKDIEETILALEEKWAEDYKGFLIEANGKVRYLVYEQVFYVSSLGNYLYLKIDSDEIKVRGTLKKFTKDFPSFFICPTPGIVINVKKIKEIHKGTYCLIMKDGCKIGISKNKINSVITEFIHWVK